MDTEVVVKPPTIPGKWDIIPIHTSDVASFKRCRRYWDWTSPTRTNLRRNVTIYGVNFPLFFGSAIHYALEMFYDPILRRDPVESFMTYWNYNWEGGTVSEDWLERVYDPSPRVIDARDNEKGYSDGRYEYVVKGLRDLLPNPEIVIDEFEQHRELGIGMMEFYKDFANRNDNFIIVARESTYSIPLGFEATDQREESPNYGNKLEVHARGKRDGILYWPDHDRYGIIDHKTAGRVDEDEIQSRLEKDEQCSNYLWATKEEAKIHGYAWSDKPIDMVVYNVLRKNYPHPPLMLDSGWPSLDKAKQGTNADMFMELVKSNEKYTVWYESSDKAQAFYDYLCGMGDDLFVQRFPATRNKQEVERTGDHLRLVALDIVDDPSVYPNPTNDFRCRTCAFRQPCIAKDDGSDWQGMLATGYVENVGR